MRTVNGAEWAKLQSPPPERIDVMDRLSSKPGVWYLVKECEIPEDQEGLEIRTMRGVFVRWVGKKLA